MSTKSQRKKLDKPIVLAFASNNFFVVYRVSNLATNNMVMNGGTTMILSYVTGRKIISVFAI